jgi:hypothetical protein
MIKYLKRFTLPSIAAMIATVCFLGIMNIRLASTGFTTSRGIPFKWYTWSDFGGKDTYHWWAIPGNILFAIAVAIVVGIIVEKILPKPVPLKRNK